MLRQSCRSLRGMDLKALYPNGLPKRTFPYIEHPKHIAMAPMADGFYLTKNSLGWPLQAPFRWDFYRSSITLFVLCVTYDLIFGLPIPMLKESVPGKPKHFFFNNNAGVPHHFWQFQDGWSVPNMSGARRWTD